MITTPSMSTLPCGKAYTCSESVSGARSSSVSVIQGQGCQLPSDREPVSLHATLSKESTFSIGLDGLLEGHAGSGPVRPNGRSGVPGSLWPSLGFAGRLEFWRSFCRS